MSVGCGGALSAGGVFVVGGGDVTENRFGVTAVAVRGDDASVRVESPGGADVAVAGLPSFGRWKGAAKESG